MTGGNSALLLESGLMPFETRYHLSLHRYFKHLQVSKSDIVMEALHEHAEGDWMSPYRELIQKITRKYEVSGMSKGVAKNKILEISWGKVLTDLYSMKSLRFYSVRGERWSLPGHVNDLDVGAMLCKYRTGNAGLGNRAPLGGRQRSQNCLLCGERGRVRRLNEEHVVFYCMALKNKQRVLGLEAYKLHSRSDECLLWRYLGGDGCSEELLQERGRKLVDLTACYMKLMVCRI